MANNVGYKQWLRKCRLIIKSKTAGTIDLSMLRIAFKIEKTTSDTPNLSQISIMNPAPTLITSIKNGDEVTLEAGYENGNFGMIFSGEVVQAYKKIQDGTDRIVDILCSDGDQFLNKKFTFKTVAKGTTAEDRIGTLTEGEAVGKIGKEVKKQATLPRGKTYFGQSSKYLNKMATGSDSIMYVDNGKINVVGADDYDDSNPVDLRPDTGLIDEPQQTDDGITAKCLLNPSIKLNGMVHIDPTWIREKRISKADEATPAGLYAEGKYRVVKITYSGDTRGEDWYCSFDASTQDGKNAAGNANSPTKNGSTSGGKSRNASVGYQMMNPNWAKGK